MKVVDSSVMIDVLLSSPRAEGAIAHLDDELVAPEALIAEVHHFFRRAYRAGELTRDQVDSAARALHDSPIEYVSTWHLADQRWSWGDNISAYDTQYVAVALRAACPLLTADLRLARACHGLVPVIEVR